MVVTYRRNKLHVCACECLQSCASVVEQSQNAALGLESVFFVEQQVVSAMAAAPKKKVIAKLVTLASMWSSGSGDPEITDGQDMVDVMSDFLSTNNKQESFQKSLADLDKRVCALKGIGSLPGAQDRMPVPSTEALPLVITPDLLGVSERHRLTGKAKTVRVLEVLLEFAERPFDSRSNPLQVELPQLPSGSVIPLFSVGYHQGFTRALATLALLRAVIESQLNDQELTLVLPEVAALLRINVVVMPAMSVAERVNATINSKMSMTERLRLDPIQLRDAFALRAKNENVELVDKINVYIQELCLLCAA